MAPVNMNTNPAQEESKRTVPRQQSAQIKESWRKTRVLIRWDQDPLPTILEISKSAVSFLQFLRNAIHCQMYDGYVRMGRME